MSVGSDVAAPPRGIGEIAASFTDWVIKPTRERYNV